MHVEWRDARHALQGFEAVKGNLRATRDELEELSVLLLVKAVQNLEQPDNLS